MRNVMMTLIGGAIGGALVVLVAMQNPEAARLFGGDRRSSERQVVEQSLEDEAAASLVAFEAAVVAAAEAAQPAVVAIVVTKDVPIIERFYEEVPFEQFDPFGGFFGDTFSSPFGFRVPQFRERGTERREVGGGSGFLVSADGLIVTNRHVVAEDDVEYSVFMNDGTQYAAQVQARDPVHDLAVLKIEGQNLPFLEFAESDELRVGQAVVAIGNALAEFRNTVSLGVVSGLARSIVAGNGQGQSEQLDGVIQTDAAINPGNSGGPLLDLRGRVIGVNVAVALGSENIGFALPVKIVRGVVDSVQETGRIVRPFIGVRYMPITATVQEANNLSVDFGVLVIRGETVEELAVIPGSPADKAGIVEGDIILEADGARLDMERSLASVIRAKGVGDAVRLKVLSKGGEKEVIVTLEEIPL